MKALGSTCLDMRCSGRHRSFVMLVLLGVMGHATAQVPAFQWTEDLPFLHSPDQDPGMYRNSGLEVDLEGNSYVFADFKDSVEVDPSAAEHWLYSQDAAYLLVKYDPEGALLWSAFFTAPAPYEIEIFDLAVDDVTDRLYFTGYYQGPVDIDPGPDTVIMQPQNLSHCNKSFIAEFDLDGNYISYVPMGMGCQTSVTAYALDVTPDHKVAVAGTYKGAPDMDPVGTFTLPFRSDDAPFAALYDVPFALETAFGIAGGVGYFEDVTVAANGNIALVGSVKGIQCDFDPSAGMVALNTGAWHAEVCALYDSGFDLLWAKRMTTSGGDGQGYEVEFDAAGQLYVLGVTNFVSTSPMDLDTGPGSATSSSTQWGSNCCIPHIVKLDEAGNYLWGNFIYLRVNGYNGDLIHLLDDVLVVCGEAYDLDMVMKQPGQPMVSLPGCNDGLQENRSIIAGLSASTGALSWVLQDTVNCMGGGVVPTCFKGNAAGDLMVLAEYGALVDGSFGQGGTLLSSDYGTHFLTRFNYAGLPTTAPVAAGATERTPLARTYRDVHGRLLLTERASGSGAWPADGRLGSGIYFVEEVFDDGTRQVSKRVFVD